MSQNVPEINICEQSEVVSNPHTMVGPDNAGIFGPVDSHGPANRIQKRVIQNSGLILAGIYGPRGIPKGAFSMLIGQGYTNG